MHGHGRLPSARGPNSIRPLEPAHGLAVGERLCRAVKQPIARQRGVARARRREPRLRFAIVKFQAEIGAHHAVRGIGDRARPVDIEVIDGQRRAQRAAGVSRRRLHPNVVELAVAQHLAVCNAVKPPAPEVRMPAFAAWPAALRRPAPPATLARRPTLN